MPNNRHLNMIKRQRAMMQDVMAAIGLMGQEIPKMEEEETRLNYLEAEYERATLRGETPDPNDVARLEADRAAFFQRCEKLNAHMQTMGQQAEAVTQAANDCLFEELRRQFNAQFNRGKTPPGGAA